MGGCRGVINGIAYSAIIVIIALLLAWGLGAAGVDAQAGTGWTGVANPDYWYHCTWIDLQGTGASQVTTSTIGFETCQVMPWDYTGAESGYNGWMGEFGVWASAYRGTFGTYSTQGMQRRRTRIIPPQAVEGFAYACNVDMTGSYSGTYTDSQHFQAGSNRGGSWTTWTSATGFTHEWNDHGPAATWFDRGIQWLYIGDAQPWGSTNPLTDSGWPSWYMQAVVGTTGNHWVNGQMDCQIYGVYLKEAWEWMPSGDQIRTPPPTPVPTNPPFSSTPWESGIYAPGTPWAPAIWPTPIAFVSTPEPVGFDVGSVGTGCYVVVPEFAFGPYTIFSYEIDIGWDEVEVCITDQALEMELYGVDFGAWVVGLVLLGALGVFYSRLR